MQRKVALVTGAARRIGAAIASALHAAEYDVVVHCYSAVEEGHALVKCLNETRSDSAFLVQCDLRNEEKLASLFEKMYHWRKQLDALINNASLFYRDLMPCFKEATLTEALLRKTFAQETAIWSEMFLMNVRIPFLLSQYAYPQLKKSQGVIINLTDIHADKPLKDYSMYCQTKAALVMQTKALAREFAPDVRVNAVAPGAIIWPEKDNQLSQAQQEKIIAKTPLRRHGDPCFISEAVLALVRNQFITGQILNVDGGRSVA